MLNCFERHFEKVSVLVISRNKIGAKGARCLADSLKLMKSLSRLDLSHDEIGDLGIGEII